MKAATTVRNLMLTMLVMGVAGSIVGIGTFAQFNAVTSNPSNTFATGNIVFSNQPNGGATCTGTSGTNSGVATGCATLVTIGSNMVAGDSKLGTLALGNTSSSARAITLGLQVTGTGGVLENAVANASTSGLGLLLFQCQTSTGVPTACSTNNVLLTQVYPTTGTCAPGTVAGGLTTSKISTTAVSNTASVQVNSVTCTGGSVLTGSTVTVSGTDLVSAGTYGLATGTTDNLAAIVYLPSPAGNSQASTSDTLSFTWTATQINGTSQ